MRRGCRNATAVQSVNSNRIQYDMAEMGTLDHGISLRPSSHRGRAGAAFPGSIASAPTGVSRCRKSPEVCVKKSVTDARKSAASVCGSVRKRIVWNPSSRKKR